MKKEIRNKMREQRKNLYEEDKKNYALDASKKLFESKEWKEAKVVKSYVTNENHGELDTSFVNEKALAEGKTLLLPRINKTSNLIEAIVTKDLSIDNFTKGAFGIKEPVGKEEMIPDLVIVPGIAFDKDGNRIGYGGGYYDKYLSNKKVFKIGFLYDFQLIKGIKSEKHDVKMDKIIIAEK